MIAPAPAANVGPELRDIHLPPTPDWWPLAPGWWLLGLLLLILLGVGIWYARRWRKRRRMWAPVSAELDALAARHAETGNQAELAAGLSQLLRRAVIYCGGEAQRQGDAWQAQLARLAPGSLSPALVRDLDHGVYRKDASLDAGMALMSCRRWLRRVLRAHA